MKPIFLALFITSIIFISGCQKHDGKDAARLDSVTVLGTSSGDAMIQTTDTWVRLQLKGLWYDRSRVGSVEIDNLSGNSCGSSYSFESFTETQMITTIYINGGYYKCPAGKNKIYIHEGADEMSFSAYDSNKIDIYFY